ncbi:MAG: hypothetical protein ACREE0_15760 [Phenylobacterium sp.]
MKLTRWICAAAMAVPGLVALPAHADTPRSVFCVATRATTRLDQDNYVSGAMGRVYVTRNFTTDLPDSTLISAWRAYIIAKHPSTSGGIPDDSCYPDNARRSKVSTFGDVKSLTVNWTPAAPKPAEK